MVIRPAPIIPVSDQPSCFHAYGVRVQGGYIVVFVRPDFSFSPFPNGAMTRDWT